MNFWARLAEGDTAHEHLRALLAKATLLNLFDDYPPYQIDGNFGGAAGIAEMLVQSHAGEIAILPTLPKAWPSGRVSGLRARGGIELDIVCKDGRLLEAHIRAARDGSWTFRAPVPMTALHGSRVGAGASERVEITLSKGEHAVLRPE